MKFKLSVIQTSSCPICFGEMHGEKLNDSGDIQKLCTVCHSGWRLRGTALVSVVSNTEVAVTQLSPNDLILIKNVL